MNAKHTPGPWLQSWCCDPPTGSDAAKYEGFEVVTKDSWPVAFVPIHFVFPPVRAEMNKRELDWDEASANLRLISAAPDLLAALQNLENDDGSIPDHAWKLVQDAIAKATGVQP